MSFKIGFSVFASVLTLHSAAFADGWSTSFAPAQLATAFSGKTRLAVIAAGESAEPAATALRRVLTDADDVALVIDQQPIGGSAELGMLDDAHILGRAAGLPLDGTAIVRLYRGRRGRPDSAFVALYHGSERLFSFSVAEGELMSAPTPAPLPTLPSTAQTSYDRAHLSVSESFHIALFATRHELEYLEGNYQKPIAGDLFFQRVGRPDLARRYSSRQRARKALMAVGAVMMVAGIAGMATGIAFSVQSPSCSSYSSTHVCVAHEQMNEDGLVGGLLGGLAGIGGGVGIMTAGAVMRAQPISTGEAHELADEYNGKLRRSLGLDAASASASQPVPLRWTLAPSLSPTSAGLSLALSY